MNPPAQDQLAIIGIAEMQIGWYPEMSCIELAVEVVKSALDDAGIAKGEIGAFLLVPPLARERDEYHMTFCRLQEEMGIHETACMNMQVSSWGASPILAIEAAGSLIRNGDISTAIVYNAQNFSGASEQDLYWYLERNNRGFHREWERHFGITNESMVAMITRRYMHETGTTEADLAAVSDSLNQWAIRNELARPRGRITGKEVRESAVRATPLRAAEKGKLSDGAAAFIVTSADRAKRISERQPVFVLGSGHAGPPAFSYVQKADGDFTRLGFSAAVSAALSSSQCQVSDIDLFELYAAFPVFYLMQVEELGLCERGEAGAFFRDGMAAPGGKYAISTNGGIQQGYTGLGLAMSTITEAVRQLRHEAGRRQVGKARTALVSGFGNQMLDSHALILGTGANS